MYGPFLWCTLVECFMETSFSLQLMSFNRNSLCIDFFQLTIMRLKKYFSKFLQRIWTNVLTSCQQLYIIS